MLNISLYFVENLYLFGDVRVGILVRYNIVCLGKSLRVLVRFFGIGELSCYFGGGKGMVEEIMGYEVLDM